MVEELFKLQDIKYREVQIKTITNINPDTIIGVRTPDLRKLAKKLYKSNNYKDFIEDKVSRHCSSKRVFGLLPIWILIYLENKTQK